ncbi:MAG: hypothetical protein WD875_18620 [Pirellulales bacterium]
MKTICLIWYVAAMLVVLAFVASVIRYVPEAQRFGNILAATLGFCAVVAVAVAIWIGRLAADHPIRKSKTIAGVCIAAAVAVTLLTALVG